MPRINTEISFTSPSLARLLKHYGSYCKECMSEGKHISTLQEFYSMNKVTNISRSLIYEQYLGKIGEAKQKENQ